MQRRRVSRGSAVFYAGPSPIRLIDDIGPVKGANNTDLMCGLGAQKAQMVVPANPGSKFSVQWSGGDGVSNVWLDSSIANECSLRRSAVAT